MVGDVCRYRRDRRSVLEHASNPGARDYGAGDHGPRHSRPGDGSAGNGRARGTGRADSSDGLYGA